MRRTRSTTPGLWLALVIACTPKPSGLDAGVAFLLGAQQADGSWRASSYPGFRDGASLTPLVLLALEGVRSPQAKPAIERGLDFLTSLTRSGEVDAGEQGLSYPVYSAALSARALHAGNRAQPRDAWLRLLRQHQLTERLGWVPDDWQYGGWGYAAVPPQKPKPGELAPGLFESNVSATALALEALLLVGHGDPEVSAPARVFLERVQNFPGDGGFFFIPSDPVRNKAGAIDGGYRSYGSATADGLRALLAAGFPNTADRVLASRRWLVERFDAERQAGEFAESHAGNREAVYYYYAAAVALALERAEVTHVGDGRSWRSELARALLARRRGDGSWSNPDPYVHEDEPVVATSWAVVALAATRR